MAELLLGLSTTVFLLAVLSLSSPSAGVESKPFARVLSPSSMGLNKPDQLSHLHFYFHDIVAGENATAIRVAKAPTTTASSPFGAVVVIDDRLTVGPDIDSKLVGRAQGIYVTASQTEASLLMAYNFAFMEGEYKGSSLALMGRNPVFSDVREMPVIGGSGVFRLARGYAEARTSRYDYDTGNAIVEYNVYVLHSESLAQSSNHAPSSNKKLISQFLCIFILYILILEV
ncbi:dirigent protein 22-like [Hibiscus syriacus]|uniref:dirigent protein 22-like n=1 Tax=Hibiscus syriacus TaxID=106335 RepID=UPI001922B59D|nr:dirigent protein 22-like [Hibiscus syriacus]